MSKPNPYSEKELEVGPIPSEMSIFTSKFFRSMPVLLGEIGFPQPKWDYTDADLLLWLNNNAKLFSGAYTGVDSIIGDKRIELDNTNLSLALASYASAAEDEKMPNYFPTPALIEALQGTELRWIDAEVFSHLPNAFTIRFPVKDQFRMLMGDGWHSMDDFLLMRAVSPLKRKHIFMCHGESNPEPDWEAWYWLSQSRSEVAKGLQNTTYGSFIIKENTKLSDLMTYIENWSRQTDDKLREKVTGEGLTKMLSNVQATGDSRFRRDNAEYFKAAVESRINYSEEGYKTYLDALKFVLKFAILMNTEQFSPQNMPVPGTKPGKISKKAAEIRQKMLWKWGKRYKIDVPRHENPENEPENADSHHKTPVRHWVMGFFRNQPYGVGRSLRKIKWIPGFWRGTDQITSSS